MKEKECRNTLEDLVVLVSGFIVAVVVAQLVLGACQLFLETCHAIRRAKGWAFLLLWLAMLAAGTYLMLCWLDLSLYDQSNLAVWQDSVAEHCFSDGLLFSGNHDLFMGWFSVLGWCFYHAYSSDLD